MANANDILAYLPNSFKTRDEQDYINFLWESYVINYDNSKYQFSFLAFHMIFMSYCYFQIWKIYNTHSEQFKKSLLGFEKLDEIVQKIEDANVRNRAENRPIEQLFPYSLSEVNERTVMVFFKLIGCDKTKIGKYKKIVDERNEIAHANGKMIFVSVRDIDNKIHDMIRLVEEIFNHSKDVLNIFFQNFLITSADPENREYFDNSDQIREILIFGNYLSQKDIEFMLTFDITRLSTKRNYAEMKALYDVFKENYTTA